MWLGPEMKIHAPEIGRAWYNTAPLAMRELRGRVVSELRIDGAPVTAGEHPLPSANPECTGC